MKLPNLKLHPAPEWQKTRLERWLAEWEIDRDIRAVGDEQKPPCCHPKGEGGSINEPAPEPGQIRLFSPELPSTSNRLLYVALLEGVDEDLFLAVPYGRFAEPCLPGELLTGREAPCLRVLCLWNAAELPGELLEQSWVVDALSEEEMAEAVAVLQNIRANSALPVELERRVGPPKWHPDDPRVKYIGEETRFMKELLHDHEAAGKTISYPEKDQAWPKAAEPHEPYETGETPEEE